MCHTLHDVAVTIRCSPEETVEWIEQPSKQAMHDARWRIFRRATGLEQHGRKRRRQRQGIERGDQRREGNGKSELPVELPVQTPKNPTGTKNADKNSGIATVGPVASPMAP